MAIAPFPHEYTVALKQNELSAVDAPSIGIGAPQQFGGTDDVWSPEHLLLGAVLSCFKTTFDAYCRRDKLVVQDLRARATALLARTNDGPTFRQIEIAVDIVAADVSGARAAAVNAEHNCIISRALVAPVRVSARVTAPAIQLPSVPA